MGRAEPSARRAAGQVKPFIGNRSLSIPPHTVPRTVHSLPGEDQEKGPSHASSRPDDGQRSFAVIFGWVERLAGLAMVVWLSCHFAPPKRNVARCSRSGNRIKWNLSLGTPPGSASSFCMLGSYDLLGHVEGYVPSPSK